MKEFINSVLPIPTLYQLIVASLASCVLACIGYAGRNYLKASEEFRNTIYTSLEGKRGTLPPFLGLRLREAIEKLGSVPNFPGSVPNFPNFL